MASMRVPLPMVKVMAASKAQAKEPEKKSFIGWLAGKFEKEQLVETDPLLKKVEGTPTTNGAARPLGKTAFLAKKKGVSPPSQPQEKPGLFGLFGNNLCGSLRRSQENRVEVDDECCGLGDCSDGQGYCCNLCEAPCSVPADCELEDETCCDPGHCGRDIEEDTGNVISYGYCC